MFSIDPGLQITIPNHQFVNSEDSIDSNGQHYLSNTTDRLTAIYSNEEVALNAIISLGQPFLSSAYMMVDEYKQQFTLWQSQPSSTQDIVSQGAAPCNGSERPTSDSSPSSAPVSKGAIAGAAIGVVVLTAVCCTAVWILAKRTIKRRLGQSAEPQSKPSSIVDTPAGFPLKSELPTDRIPARELPLERDASLAIIPPYEMLDKETSGASELPNHENSTAVVTSELPDMHQRPATELPGDS